MIPRWIERLGGVGLIALGCWLVVASWRAAHSGERFFAAGPALGPFAIGLGVGLLLYPSPRSMAVASGRDGARVRWADLTPAWKLLVGGGGALGIAYLLSLMLGIL